MHSATPDYGKISPMNKNILGLFLLAALFTLPNISLAADIGSITVGDARMTQQESSLQVAFSVRNISDTEQDVSYGIRLQSTIGSDVYEVPVDIVSLKPTEELIKYATIPLPSTASGTHEVFLLSRDEMGLVSILKYAGVIDIVQRDTSEPMTISDCSLSENGGEILCNITNTESTIIDINYIVNKGSKYGSIVTEGVSNNTEILDNQVTIATSDTLAGGDYTYRLWLIDKTLAQEVVIHIAGDDTEASEGLFSQQVNPANGEQGYTYARLAIMLLPVLLLFALLYVALRRPKVGVIVLAVTGLSLSSIAFAAVTLADTQPLAHIFNGFSQDSGNEQFAITLDATEFQATDTIGFSLVFQDTMLPNAKPTGGSIDINVDGGAWITLVASTDTGSIYHKTLSALGTVGTHTLNFRSPDLCGGAFGFSVFNYGIFGTTECLFSVPVTVVHNDPPTTPIIGGNCILGEPCSVGIVSTDTDGGELCYEAQWPDGTSGAGCSTEGSPISIPYTFNSCNVAGTTVQAQATDTSSEQSEWGIGASNIPGSILCTEPCTHCTYDGTEGDIGISALPPFLPPDDGVVEIQWSLTNIATCNVEGREVDSGTLLDSWDWDTVRANSGQSTTLESATEYTLTCTDLEGTIQTASVIISTIPIWQEF